MLRSIACLTLLCSLALLPGRAGAAPAAHPDSSAWDDLFAKDLHNAIFPAGVWYWEHDELTATKDQNIWTAKVYHNAVVDLEFKTDPGTNSGVFVYGSDVKNWVPNSVEVQIADDFAPKWANSPASWHCAAIFGRKPPTRSLVKKPGEWNRMTVTCQGPLIDVILNGEAVNAIDMRQWTSARKNPDGSDIPPWLSKPLATMPTQGHLGLQGKHAGVPIHFRNLKVKATD